MGGGVLVACTVLRKLIEVRSVHRNLFQLATIRKLQLQEAPKPAESYVMLPQLPLPGYQHTPLKFQLSFNCEMYSSKLRLYAQRQTWLLSYWVFWVHKHPKVI